MDTKAETVERLTARLEAGIELRGRVRTDAEATRRRLLLRDWQSDRLARTHFDLLADARFHDTAEFFLTELYGAKDTVKRDADIARVVPTIAKMLPIWGLETVADAIELDTLSEVLDVDMVTALGARIETIDAAAYGAAYRKVGRRAEREHQIDLIEHLGHALDHLTHHAFTGTALTLMRRPARLAGFGDLQTFLEDGYRAFRKMGGADEFLERIVSRERAVMTALFDGDDTVLDDEEED
ncbi:FFLEELY motif protein [Pinisolibacter sp.]|uniref:FFLEELY motif protein n=1 Tax=Pinisolibacter sp. TaxID=2172024 RepID=UPI002FDD7D22